LYGSLQFSCSIGIIMPETKSGMYNADIYNAGIHIIS
jgi:hypothetical protein